MISGYESAHQAAMQTFLVPVVPTAVCAWSPATCHMWAAYSLQQGGYPTNTDHNAGGKHWNSKTLKRGQRDSGATPYFKEPEDQNVTVVLSNLPKVLRSEKGFEVALDASGMKEAVRVFAIEQTNTGSEAVVILKSETAAQIIMKHFKGVSCGQSSGGVTARYCAERGKKLLPSKVSEDQVEMKSQETAFHRDESPNAFTKSTQSKANTTSPLVLTRTNLKMRPWADYEDDHDSDCEDDSQSTSADAVRSSSDGTESVNFDEP
jgi:hypothetical protein